MNNLKQAFGLILLFLPFLSQAQIPSPTLPPDLINKPWPAQWIAVAGEPVKDYGIYYFRKNIDLSAKPASFMVHVSGDSRYKLFVNGQQVCFGPARGDVNHWNFETIDLAPFLKSGKNTLAAVVWNFGEHNAVAQISHRTGFIMQGNSVAERMVDTGKSWRGIKNPAYSPIHTNLYRYFVIGPGEVVDASKYLWGWETENFDATNWKEVVNISPGLYGGMFEPYYYDWGLQARTIPAMEMKLQRLAAVRKATGIKVPNGF